VKKARAILLAALAVILVHGLALAAAEDASQVEHRQLVVKGAKLWPVYCNQCHNARPGSEKAPYEWNQIMMHMRTLGNVPPDDAKAILEYLKTAR
jgi:mono/diheme cytochrome c family protein